MRRIIFCICTVLIFFSGCGKEVVNQQELITEYVKNNKDAIIEIINKMNSVDEETIIKEFPKDIKIDNMYSEKDANYIRFGVKEGLTSFSHYYGFYYSTTNEAKTVMALPGEKTEYENGYRIQEPGNEDWYYTEKIIDNFYFYEAHY